MKRTKIHPVYLKAKRGEYVEVTDLAALIRSALSRAFPAVKFSVRSKSYSGGSSVHIGWTDGPTQKEVDAITRRYSTKGFDGMIDLAHYSSLWLAPDGSVCCAHDGGTQGSRGTVPEYIGSAHHPDAILLDRCSGSYVFASRSVSRELWAKAANRALVRYAWRTTRWGNESRSVNESEAAEMVGKCISGRFLDPQALPALYFGSRPVWEMVNEELSTP